MLCCKNNAFFSKSIDDVKDWKSYFTHYNYCRPYCVYINLHDSEVVIFKIDDSKATEENQDDYASTYTHFVSSFTPQKIFIGESPLNEMTEFSAGHGPDFDGNSILLKMDTNEYIFICDMIFSFKSKHEIITFVSPVGNNDVPYPYAIDTENNYYFLAEHERNGVLKTTTDGDPYHYYYDVIGQIAEIEKIDCIYIGEDDEEYNIKTSPIPEKDYNSLIRRIGSPIYIKFKGQEKRIISKDEYVELLESYNKKVGLEPLCDFKVIVKQDI